MDTQNGLVKALGEMGFYKSGKETAQIQWEARVFFASINSRKLHQIMEKVASPFWRKLQVNVEVG